MKALILAAGLGTRLRPITDTKPKSMVEVNGKPIIFKQIDNLIKYGINDITIIAGYKSEMLIKEINEKYSKINIIVNNIYDKTNNMYSAYMAVNDMYNNDFLLMNADVFYDESIIEELLNDIYKNAIVVEKDVYNDESMKISCINERIAEISKKIPKMNAYGVSIDVYKFSKEGSKIFFDKIKEYIEYKKDLNQWTEVAINEILQLIEFKPCLLKGRWVEIDNFDDLAIAERIFND